MKDYMEDRVIAFSRYIIENSSTVRETAKHFFISKSTVHKDVTERLKHIDPDLYEQVRTVLNFNKAERHIRGGLATKEKYAKIHKKTMPNGL